eukprot:4620179-Pyramimonas_sp.AAC.1
MCPRLPTVCRARPRGASLGAGRVVRSAPGGGEKARPRPARREVLGDAVLQSCGRRRIPRVGSGPSPCSSCAENPLAGSCVQGLSFLDPAASKGGNEKKKNKFFSEGGGV